MREIKFRAWDGDKIISLSMAYTLQYVAIQDNDENSKYANELSVEYADVVLMQYTGLKDKNGADIYEGDIIKYDFNKFNYRIEFLNAEFIARRFYENIENLYPSEFDYGKECKVIGNIYENSELLK